MKRLVASVFVRCAFVLTVSAVIGCRPALAATPAPGVQDKTSGDKLLDELDDIDFMRSLTPLKLSKDQIDRLITAISDAKANYDKKIADLSDATVGAMADDIHKRHKEAVAGAPVSDKFDAKVKQVMTDFYAKRDTINFDNLQALSTTCSKILTSDQQKSAVELEKEAVVKLGQKLNPADKDAQFFNKYVVDIFIGYRRIVPLLKEMKASAA